VTAAVIVAVAVALVFAACGPALGRRLPPAAATRLLATGSVLVAGCSVFVTGVLAFTWIGQLPVLAHAGEWSVAELRSADPIPTGVAAGCTVLLLPAAGWWLWVVARRGRDLVALHRNGRQLRAAGAVVVVDDERPDAFTVGDRRTAARALARAALVTRNPEVAQRLALAAAAGNVPGRVRALLAPPPRRRPVSVVVLAALLAVLAAATVVVQHRGEQLFEYAKHHSAATSRHQPTPAASVPAAPDR
jgi:hypothetical protein